MTISSSRIRFLDRENKVLVQDFSDLKTNAPLTDVQTPLTIEDMDRSIVGRDVLFQLQRELAYLLNSLSDGNISSFLINTILNNFKLNIPGFPAVGIFVNSLRSSNPYAFTGLINSLIRDASNIIFETPSLINTQSGDVRQQIINIALNNFAQKLQNGDVDTVYINQLANSGTDDPYQIKGAVNKVLSDYNYETKVDGKFLLPVDKKTSGMLVCYMSLCFGYYNYLYSTLKLIDKTTKASQFVNSITAQAQLHGEILSQLKLEVSKAGLDHESTFYYIEQITREIILAILSQIKNLNYSTQQTLLNTFLAQYKNLVNINLGYQQQNVDKNLSGFLNTQGARQFANKLINDVKNNTTIPSEQLRLEYIDFLRSSLHSFIKAGNKYSTLSSIYLLSSSRQTLCDQILELRVGLTDNQTTALFSILEFFFTEDLYLLEGNYESGNLGLGSGTPILRYIKVTAQKFFTTCLDYFKLAERQFAIMYPKDGSMGLLANLTDKMSQSRLDLVKNNFYVRTVVIDPNATYLGLQQVLTPDLLYTNFYPLTYNSYDLKIYNMYKQPLDRFIFLPEEVIVS